MFKEALELASDIEVRQALAQFEQLPTAPIAERDRTDNRGGEPARQRRLARLARNQRAMEKAFPELDCLFRDICRSEPSNRFGHDTILLRDLILSGKRDKIVCELRKRFVAQAYIKGYSTGKIAKFLGRHDRALILKYAKGKK